MAAVKSTPFLYLCQPLSLTTVHHIPQFSHTPPLMSVKPHSIYLNLIILMNLSQSILLPLSRPISHICHTPSIYHCHAPSLISVTPYTSPVSYSIPLTDTLHPSPLSHPTPHHCHTPFINLSTSIQSCISVSPPSSLTSVTLHPFTSVTLHPSPLSHFTCHSLSLTYVTPDLFTSVTLLPFN